YFLGRGFKKPQGFLFTLAPYFFERQNAWSFLRSWSRAQCRRDAVKSRHYARRDSLVEGRVAEGIECLRCKKAFEEASISEQSPRRQRKKVNLACTTK
ncbi:hypothetical protein AGABI2DRAFT_190216, partial [Agaricus bisporus var. bisporus H97]|uniref:hypothetical protein n=1 Tax=Agaricus bisporus var. bisporus (strain H97 / ATCC MYA-4626 / FGSC 10389) TaxID=936046 RepID=UPI00029F669E